MRIKHQFRTVERLFAWRKGQEKFAYCLDSNGYLLDMRAIQGHSGGNRVDPSLQDNVEIPPIWMKYIHHAGSSHDCHSVIWSAGVEDEPYDVTRPTTGTSHNQMESVPERNDVGSIIKKCVRQRMNILANTFQCYIILDNSVPADCLENVKWYKPKLKKS